MRDILEVIKQIKEVVPENEIEFHKQLNWVAEDSVYKAPEVKHISWKRLMEAFQKYLPEVPKEDWQWKAASIITTKSIEELKIEMT